MQIPNEILTKLSENKMAPIIGNPKGKNIIYEFFDYNCGHCRGQEIVFEELLQKNKDIKIVLKSFPIFQVSHIPALAIIASGIQGKAFEINKALFENPLLPMNYSEISTEKLNQSITEKIWKIAQKHGIDTQKLIFDMQSENVYKEISQTREIAHKLGIHGTPALIINNELFPGFMDIEEISSIIK